MKELSKALIKFHSLVGKVGKNSTNPYFKSKYGDLNSYLEVIKEPLAECGLAFSQLPIENGLKTIIMHESGETLESEFKMTFPNDIQKIGACLTYLRRYMLSSMLGLNAEDTDGIQVKSTPKAPVKQVNKQDLYNEINSLYTKISNPSDNLDIWMGALDTYDIVELKNGLKRIRSIK